MDLRRNDRGMLYLLKVQGEDELRVRVYSSWDELASIGKDWEQLLQQSANPTIFSTTEWLRTWWDAYGQGKQLITVAISNSSGELTGLIPLYVEVLPGWIRRLRLVGDGTHDSDNLTPIFRSGQEEACTEIMLDWLSSSRWDLCELNTLPANSPSISPLLRGLKKRGWVHATYERPSSVVVLPETWEAYLEQLPREHARGIERYMRRLERHYAVRILKCTEEEELAAYLKILFDLHQRRWKSRGELGAFASPRRKEFYAYMSRALLRRNWLEFWLLELGGKTVAAQFAFRYGNTVYQLQEGLDPTYYSDRAGQVLRAHIMKQLIAEGVRYYDYLGGAETHKQNWGAQVGSYIDTHFVTRSFSRAYLYMHTRHNIEMAIEWLHANAPLVYTFLQDTYYQIHHEAQ